MQLYLRQTRQALPAPRFARLMLQEDLLGGWELIRETGQIGGKSRIQRELFTHKAQALDALEQARATFDKRGFTPSEPFSEAR